MPLVTLLDLESSLKVNQLLNQVNSANSMNSTNNAGFNSPSTTCTNSNALFNAASAGNSANIQVGASNASSNAAAANSLLTNEILSQIQNMNINSKLLNNITNNLMLNGNKALATSILNGINFNLAQQAQNKQVNYSRYKTELCRQFSENGECKYGDKCQFAHGLNDLKDVNRHPKYKTDFCKTFHSKGFCPYGPRCHFIHDLSEKFDLSLIASLSNNNNNNSNSAKNSVNFNSSLPNLKTAGVGDYGKENTSSGSNQIDKDLEAIHMQLTSTLFSNASDDLDDTENGGQLKAAAESKADSKETLANGVEKVTTATTAKKVKEAHSMMPIQSSMDELDVSFSHSLLSFAQSPTTISSHSTSSGSSSSSSSSTSSNSSSSSSSSSGSSVTSPLALYSTGKLAQQPVNASESAAASAAATMMAAPQLASSSTSKLVEKSVGAGAIKFGDKFLFENTIENLFQASLADMDKNGGGALSICSLISPSPSPSSLSSSSTSSSRSSTSSSIGSLLSYQQQQQQQISAIENNFFSQPPKATATNASSLLYNSNGFLNEKMTTRGVSPVKQPQSHLNKQHSLNISSLKSSLPSIDKCELANAQSTSSLTSMPFNSQTALLMTKQQQIGGAKCQEQATVTNSLLGLNPIGTASSLPIGASIKSAQQQAAKLVDGSAMSTQAAYFNKLTTNAQQLLMTAANASNVNSMNANVLAAANGITLANVTGSSNKALFSSALNNQLNW